MINRLPFLERHRIFATGRFSVPCKKLGIEITLPQDFYEGCIEVRVGQRWMTLMSVGFNILCVLLTCLVIGYIWHWNFQLIP